MHGIAVAVLSEDRERLTVLQTRLETTNLGRTNYIHLGFPMGPTDPVLRQIQDARSEIVLVDIDSHDPQRAINAIELIHATTSDISGSFWMAARAARLCWNALPAMPRHEVRPAAMSARQRFSPS